MHHYAPYHTDTRRTIGVLQQWQVLLAPCDAMAATITLTDIQAVTLALQQAFGATTTLEAIIQQLVGQDVREQLEQRRQTRPALARAAV